MEHSVINNVIITHPQSTVPPTLIEHTEYRDGDLFLHWIDTQVYSILFCTKLQCTLHLQYLLLLLANNITFLYLAEVAENSMQTNAIK